MEIKNDVLTWDYGNFTGLFLSDNYDVRGFTVRNRTAGVVAYERSSIEGVESEFIVRAEHPCRDHPFVIEEVRRILLKHVGIETNTQVLEARTL